MRMETKTTMTTTKTKTESRRKLVVEQTDETSWYAAIYYQHGGRWRMLDCTTVDSPTMALSWVGAKLSLFKD